MAGLNLRCTEDPKTNLQFAEEVLKAISDSLINTYKTENNDVGIRTGVGGRGELQLFESIFIQRCAETDVLVKLDDPGSLIHVEMVDIKITYKKTCYKMSQ